ncbi:FKBP-type peptidyl-prolyl cis-trans isomerase [Flavihumibacter rivuli]|uniref:FKBP-type peptidyl-prolyl cis-trans isomerase n=1 Tax=Flavihumibacter rivuli TaxID=2838156 RepID=UPI001BDEA6FB|nr:FKBP-type peptidyl-prolyl cis-trans isomerase [Flavihumibacter rivuli]ULQ57936.1 FKBP-type peptidyl-prolyl cis-trans isomerase [Flavihumibacter rivuli]
MKKLIAVLAVALTGVLLWSCSKSDNQSCTPVPAQNEEAQILQYVNSNNMTAVKDPSGLYYQILQEGTGSNPNLTSRVYVKYKGYLTNGTQFDALDNPSLSGWALGGLIQGWQIGIPKIKKGGKIKMVIPSSLAYGCNQVGTIPANSILVFEVELVDFN